MVLNKESSLSRFQRHEGGGILMFVLVLFLLMALSIGMAVDFMRHEMARADLQNALDRGTLAAASLSQTAAIEIDEDGDGTWDTLTDAEIEANYENLVAEYMASRSVYRDRLDLDVTWTEDTNAKTIRASASYDLPTSFLQLIGKSRLTVQVDSFARQGFNDVELAMAFDISGSMVNNNVTVEGVERTRLEQAKIDAKAFVDDVFARDTLGDQITMSLVPYSSKVSIPKGMADAFTINPAPGATVLYEDFYCFDFDVADYTTTEMDTTIAREQFPLFKINNDHWTCPKAGNEIVPITRNKEKITDAIDALTRENWTSVYEGVKWAAAMLDPSMRAAQDEMRLAGLTDLNVAALPRDYSNTGEVIKVMVVMTDGRNTEQPTMLEDEYLQKKNGSDVDGEPHDYWRTRVPNRDYNEDDWSCSGRNADDGAISKFSDECPVVSGIGNTDYGVGDQLLSDTTLLEWIEIEDGVEVINPVSEPDALLFEICDQAKDQGIIIYTIAFELSAGSRGARALKECASSDDKAYNVGGYNLAEAFDAIVADISNLKLTAAPTGVTAPTPAPGGGDPAPGGGSPTVVDPSL